MPNSVDNRVVEMQFDNAKFEKNIHQSIKSLEQLDKALELEDAAKGFENMEKAANNIDFTKLERAAEVIEKRFSAAGIAGAAAIERVTNSAINAVVGLGRKVVGLAKSGGIARALKLEHANFMLNGLLKDAGRVAEILDGPVNNAVSGTAYGLDAAANAAAQLVASGVTDMKKLENALTAISGVAAMTGAQYEEISDIFTSAAGKGKVMTMEFNRINQRGVAAFAAVAKYLNKTEEEVRDMAKKGKISFEMFAEAMNDAFGEQAKKANDTFEGALSNVKAALSRIGAKIATPALEGLRKTFVALIDVVNQINKYLSKGIIPKIVNFIKHLSYLVPLTLKSQRFMNLLTSSIDTLDKAFSNIVFVLQVVRNAFKTVFPDDAITRLQNIQKGFDKLVDMFDVTGEKAAYLQITLEGVFRVFDIIFTVVGQVLGILIPGFNNVYDATDSVIMNILRFTSYISILLEHFDKWLKQNNLLKAGLDLVTGALSKLTGQSNIFMSVISIIGGIIMGIVSVFYTIGSAIGSFLIEAYKLPIVQIIIGNIKDSIVKLGNLTLPILALMAAGFESMMNSLEKFSNGGYITKGLEKLNDALNGLYWGASYAVDGIKAFFGLFKKGDDAVEKIERVVVASEKLAAAGNDLGVTTGVVTRHANEFAGAATVLETSATSLADTTSGTFMTMEKAGRIFTIGFAASIISAGVNIGRAFREIGAVARNIKATTKSIRFFFDQLQLNLRIKTLLSLAVAIAVLAGSLALLTQLDTGKLIVATACIGALMGILAAMAKTLATGNSLAVKRFQTATKGMLEFAGALLVLAAAAKVLSSIGGSDLPTIAKGVGALIVIMLALAGVVILIGRFQKNAIKGGAAILALSAGIYLIMQSLIKIQELDLDKINAALPTMLKIMGGLALVAFATTAIISPFGGLSFAGVVAGVLLLFEGFSKLSKIDNKVLYQVEDLIDHMVMAIQHILEFLIVLQALSMLEQAFMWGTAVLTNVTKSLKGMFLMAQKGIKYMGVATIILAIALTIKTISDSIIALSALDNVAIAQGVLITAAIITAILGIVDMFIRMSARVLEAAGTDSIKAAAMFGSISALLLSMSASIAILGHMDETIFAKGFFNLNLVMLVVESLALVLSYINKRFGESVKIAIVTMAGISILIATIVGAIAVLGMMASSDLVGYQTAITSIIVLLGLISGMFVALSTMKDISIPATVAVYGIAAMFVALSYCMATLAHLKAYALNAASGMAVIIASVMAMAMVLKYLSTMQSDIPVGLAALAGITGVLILLTGVANMLNEIDPGKLIKVFGDLGIAIGVLALAMFALGAIGSTGAGGVAEILGIAVLAALATVMLEVSAAAVLFGVAATLTANGMNGIATALNNMKDIDITTIAGGLAKLAGACVLLGIAALPLLAFSNVVIFATPLLGAFGLSVNVFVNAITALSQISLGGLLTELTYLGQAVDYVLNRFFQFAGFAVIATTVGIACMTLGAGLSTVSVGLMGVVVSIDAFMAGFTVLIAAFSTLGELIDKIVMHLTDMVKSIKEMGANTVSAIYDALIEYASSQLWEAGQSMMIYIQNGFEEQIPDSVEHILNDIADGLKGETGRREADIYSTGFKLAGFFKAGMQDCLGAYCEAEAAVHIVEDVGDGLEGESERQGGRAYRNGFAVTDNYGSGLWDGVKGWLGGIGEGLKSWYNSLMDGTLFTGGASITEELEKKVSAYAGSLNKNKIYGKSLEFDVGINSGTIKYVGPGAGYYNSETGELHNTIAEAVSSANKALEEETANLGSNTGATKSNSKAKKANKKANDKKTKAIDEESESLDEETESVEDNEEAIREQAEQIFVVTKAFDGYLNSVKLMQGHYGLGGLTKSLSKFWSKGFGEKGLSTVKNIDKTFKSATKNLNTLPKSMKTVSYAFSDSGKYLGKLSKSISKTNTTMSNYANKTGKTVVKLFNDYGKVFEKNGKKIDTFNVRLSKNIKNMGKQITGYKKFVAEMNRMDVNDAIYHADSAEWFINNLRKIEKYVTTKGSASKNIQKFLNETFRKLTEGAEELAGAINILGKNIDGVGSVMNKKSQSTAYVEDAFISLAATLYDGSEAANEYATEHARLQFLMENELATVEEVAEHYESYIHRISQALYEYQQQLGQSLQDSLKVFDEFNKNLLDDKVDLLSNIESQIAGMKQWSDMLMELSKRGVDANILKLLTDEGTSSYGKLKKMLEMTSGELALFNQRYKESQQVVKDARDTALAALANATTRASERAASASKSASLAQMKTSKKLAKQLIDDAKSVAENQARYRSFTAKEEKKYLNSLTVEERKAYKKRLKEAQKAEKAEKKLADKESKKRNTEATIDKSIKSFKTLSKTYRKYIKDAEGVKYINEQIAKSLEGINGNIISVNGLTKKDMQWNFMALAETLKSTGQEGLSYFEEMQQRLEDFTKSLKDALNISDKLFDEFQKADSISFDKTFKNAVDSISNMVQFRTLTAQLNAAGASTDMWNYIYENFVNGGNIAGAVEFMKMYVEASVEQRKALESMLLQANEQQGAAEAEFASYMAESTGASYAQAVATADAELGKAREEYKKVTKDIEKELKDYQKQKAAAEARITALNAEINSAKSIQNKKQRTEKINQLNNEIANATKTITDLDKKIAELNSKRETAAKAVEESEQKATTAENNTVNGGKNAAKGMMDYYNAVAAQRDANQKALEDATAATDKDSTDYATAQKAYNDALSAFNAEENKKGKGKASKKTKEALDAAKKNFDAAKKNLDAAKANKKAAKETRDAYITETGDRTKIAEQQAYWTAEYNKYVTDEKAAAARWQQIQATIAAIKTSKAYSDALKNLINDNVLLKKVQEKAQESLKGISGAINQWGMGWKGINGLAETISPELNEITTAFLRLAETLDDVNSESEDWFENMGERLASYRDSINSTLKGQVSLFEEFKKFSGDSSTSASTYLNNMESQLSGLSEWLTNLQTLANRGVTGGILQMFASEGTASFEKVAAFINATDEQIGDLNQQYQQYTKLMEEAADKALAAVGQAYTDTALNLQNEMINKFIASGGQRIKEAAEDAGIMVITGVRDGVTNAMPEILSTVEATAQQVTQKIGDNISAAKVTQAVTQGLSSVDTAIATTLALTLNDFYDLITAQAINKFKMAVDSINQYTNSVLQDEFTITLHVDTSEFDDAIARMNMAIYDINATAGTTAASYESSRANQQAVNETSTDNSSSVTNVNYTQNNYSPKALSRTEIYRQTRNQLSTIEDVVSSANGG